MGGCFPFPTLEEEIKEGRKMGKNTATVVNSCNEKNPKKKKKKKGRPSLLDIQKRALRLIKQQQQQQQQNPNSENQTKSNSPCLQFPAVESSRRGSRQNPKLLEKGDGDVGSELDGCEGKTTPKKRKLVTVLGSSGEMIERQQLSKPKLEEGGIMELEELTTPLPDTMLLYFILDRLQNKDTYGVFSEPVDHEELPDYHDIIENPMDFSTVRKKLSDGAYPNLEAFEEDVFLISSNAMRYNSPDTIYFRQAKSIHELAKKDFENLRQESDDDNDDIDAPEPKIMQRGRPLGKNTMKKTDNSTDKALLSNAFIDKPIPADSSIRVSQHTCNRESSIWLDDNKLDGNDESSVFMLKSSISTRHRKKFTISEENHRNTYLHLQTTTTTHEPSVLTTFKGERKELIPVGLHMEHTYTRSLARFAANLGTVGWAIAAKQIERVLRPGTEFGRGWVGEKPSVSLPFKSSKPSVSQSSSTTTSWSDRIKEETPDASSIRSLHPSSSPLSMVVPETTKSNHFNGPVYDLSQVVQLASRLPRPTTRGCLVAPETLMTHAQALEMVSRGNTISSFTRPAMATINFESSTNNLYHQTKLNNSNMVNDDNTTNNKLIHSTVGQPEAATDSRNRSTGHHYHPEPTTTESQKSGVGFAHPSLCTFTTGGVRTDSEHMDSGKLGNSQDFWHGFLLNPKPESVPPNLNSPASAVASDSKQPDLALQL